MHCGVLVGAAWETGVLEVVAAFVTVGPDAGDEGCGDAHAATPTHPTAMTAINRIAFDIAADLSGRLVCRGQVLGTNSNSARIVAVDLTGSDSWPPRIDVEEARSLTPAGRDIRQAAVRFRSGLDVIIAGIQASAVW
jgi:hypothetical protein